MGGYTILRRIVRNDAIHLDPPEVYNWRVFALAAAVSIPTIADWLEGTNSGS
jgi:hypothetical protein